MKPISNQTQQSIVQRLQSGESYRSIAMVIGVGRSTVQRVRKTHMINHSAVKKGRPSKLSERNKQYCVRQITTGRKETAVEVTKALQHDLGLTVHPDTVRNALHEKGLGSFVKPKKPNLSPKNVAKRLEWANAHKDWTLDDWRRVIWSDETKINRFGTDGRNYAWKRDTEPIQPRHIQKTVKHGGGNIKLWSCISYQGVGDMVKINNNLDQYLYREILEDNLVHSLDDFKLKAKNIVFQHDNDPKHTAASVKKWLANQEFEVMDWPAQSPDLNPIENMWAILKNRLYRDYEYPPKGMINHWERVVETWFKISKEDCRKVIDTMPERCQQVIAKNGYWIDF